MLFDVLCVYHMCTYFNSRSNELLPLFFLDASLSKKGSFDLDASLSFIVNKFSLSLSYHMSSLYFFSLSLSTTKIA